VHIVGQLGSLTRFYVVRSPQGLRLLSDGAAPRLAERMLAAVEHGDVEAARHWLGWLKETLPAQVGSDDPLAGLRDNEAGAGGEAMETAAALVLASSAGARALPPLDRCLAHESAGPRRVYCARARAVALMAAKRTAEALHAFDAQLGAHPDDVFDAIMRMGLLEELGQPAEADRAAAELQRRWPNDKLVQRGMATLAMARGRCADARRALKPLLDGKMVDAQVRNEYAWCALAAGPVSDDDVAQARLAVDETGRARTGVLNTLAMLQAERGQLDAARDTLREALPAGWPVREGDWLVIGRIAEAAGLVDEARRAYAHIPAPAGRRDEDVRVVAERRRAGLGGSSAAAAPAR
jgi:predicted Zn-dependent protease